MRVYLDTCALQRPLDDWSQIRVRQEAEAVLAVLATVEAGEVELVTSDVLRFETRNNPHPARRDFALGVLEQAGHDVPASAEVRALAQTYEQRGIKPLDAAHLASAVVFGADLFCSADGPLLRNARAANTRTTRVVSPLELIAALDS